MLKKLLPFMKKYRLYAILSPVMMVLEVGADVLVPFLMSRIVDIGIKNQDMSFVIQTGLLMILLALGGMFMGVVSSFFGARAGYGFAAEIRAKAFQQIQKFSFANLDTLSAPTLITRLTTDADMMGQVAMMSLRMAIRAPFLMIFALIMSIRVNPGLSVVFAVAIPVVVIILLIVLKFANPMFKSIQRRVDRLNAIIQENLIGIRVVKSFNRQPYEEKRFKVRNDKLKDKAMKAISLIMVLMPTLNLIIYACIGAVLWFGGQQIMAGTMLPGELIAFVTYITQIMMALMMLSMYFMMLTRGSASASRLIEVLETESEIEFPIDGLDQVKDGSIEFRDAHFRYPSNSQDVLKAISLTIDSGQLVGIIGSTGSSKSSLIQLIPRLYDVTAGEVRVGGHNVKDYKLDALRQQIGMVLQKNTLVTGTIASNMRWGNEEASDEEIIEALKQAQAWEFVSKYPEGIHHEVEQSGSNFSGGQKQRLTIARALIKRPKVLILDDSTSAVDMSTDAKLRDSFRENIGDVTTIIIAQRISSIEDADTIIVMDHGMVESQGTHEELLEKSPIYREISETQERGLAG
jgi:ATP-binding cassette subfamily B protein